MAQALGQHESRAPVPQFGRTAQEAYGFEQACVVGCLGGVKQGLAARKEIALQFLQRLRPAALRRLAQHGLASRGLGAATYAEQEAAAVFRLPVRIACVGRGPIVLPRRDRIGVHPFAMLVTFAEPDVRRKISLLCGTPVPGQGQRLVLDHPVAPAIGVADLDAGPRMPATGCGSPPAKGLFKIARYPADALSVAFAQFELGIAAALLRGTAIPGHAGFGVSRDAEAEVMALAEQEHRTGQALARGDPEMDRRLGSVGRDAFAGIQAHAQTEARADHAVGRRIAPAGNRARAVLGKPAPEKVTARKQVDGFGLALPGCQLEPVRGAGEVALETDPEIQNAAAPVLRQAGAALRPLLEQAGRARSIHHHTMPA
jgi:hypothetical protein